MGLRRAKADRNPIERADGTPARGTDDAKSRASEVHSALDRASRLRGELIEFAMTPKFANSLATWVLEATDDGAADENQMADIIAKYGFLHRLPNGMSVSERLVRDNPDLPAADAAMLTSWRDAVDGIFEISERVGNGVIAVNLIDELEYEIYAPVPSMLKGVPAGGFLEGVIAPLGETGAWFTTGEFAYGSPNEARGFAAAAFTMVAGNRAAALRDPAKLAQARKALREERATFISLFGSDEWCGDRAEADKRAKEYQLALRGPREKAFRSRGYIAEFPDTTDELPDYEFPDFVGDCEKIGLIYDESVGLDYYPDLDRVREVFADPN